MHELSSDSDSDDEYQLSPVNQQMLTQLITDVKLSAPLENNADFLWHQTIADQFMRAGKYMSDVCAIYSDEDDGDSAALYRQPHLNSTDYNSDSNDGQNKADLYSKENGRLVISDSTKNSAIDLIRCELTLNPESCADEIRRVLNQPVEVQQSILHQLTAEQVSSCPDWWLQEVADCPTLPEEILRIWLRLFCLPKWSTCSVLSETATRAIGQLCRKMPRTLTDCLLVPHFPPGGAAIANSLQSSSAAAVSPLYSLIVLNVDEESRNYLAIRLCSDLTQLSVITQLLHLLDNITEVGAPLTAALVQSCHSFSLKLADSVLLSRLMLAITRRCQRHLSSEDVTTLCQSAARLRTALSRAVQATCSRLAV